MTLAEAFEQVTFLRGLEQAERARLLPHGQLKVLTRGDGCWEEGLPADNFVFIIQGRAKLVKTTEEGRDTILEMGTPGELLCANAVLCHAAHCCASIVMDDPTVVLTLPRRDVMEVVERNPGASSALMRELTQRGLSMCRRAEELAGRQVEQRIALLLLRLAARQGGVVSGAGVTVPVRLSRQDLADLCSSTLETAIRVMSRWKNAGLVETTSSGFQISDRAALQRVATGNLPRP